MLAEVIQLYGKRDDIPKQGQRAPQPIYEESSGHSNNVGLDERRAGYGLNEVTQRAEDLFPALLCRSLEEADDARSKEVCDEGKGTEKDNRNVLYDLDEPVKGVFYRCGADIFYLIAEAFT